MQNLRKIEFKYTKVDVTLNLRIIYFGMEASAMNNILFFKRINMRYKMNLFE